MLQFRQEVDVDGQKMQLTMPSDFSFSIHLMQFLVVPAFVLDPQGRVLIWNNACERLTGVRAADVFGKSDYWQAFYNEQKPSLADLIVQSRTSETNAHFEKFEPSMHHSHGFQAEHWCDMPRIATPLYLATDAGPIFDENGNLAAVIQTLRDLTALKTTQSELEKGAYIDALTGIANRRSFDNKMALEMGRLKRDGLPLSLLLIDVDHFKRFNDTYGHQAGDVCLQRIAGALTNETFRSADLAARYGGEEFAVVLPSVDENGARQVANRILERVVKLNVPHSANEGLGVASVSIGLISVVPDEQTTVETMIRAADKALYQAKNSGRNRVVSNTEQS
jgi:diguanylate cyclase (GGDEF)-like protein